MGYEPGLDTGREQSRFKRRLRPPTIFYDTTHASLRRRERQLSAVEMQETICQHEHRIQHRRGEHGGFVYEFDRCVSGKKLVVFAEVKQHECWLITGYFDEE